jgi:hypothetical protein
MVSEPSHGQPSWTSWRLTPATGNVLRKVRVCLKPLTPLSRSPRIPENSKEKEMFTITLPTAKFRAKSVALPVTTWPAPSVATVTGGLTTATPESMVTRMGV